MRADPAIARRAAASRPEATIVTADPERWYHPATMPRPTGIKPRFESYQRALFWPAGRSAAPGEPPPRDASRQLLLKLTALIRGIKAAIQRWSFPAIRAVCDIAPDEEGAVIWRRLSHLSLGLRAVGGAVAGALSGISSLYDWRPWPAGMIAAARDGETVLARWFDCVGESRQGRTVTADSSLVRI